ncbi:MAG: hypothetical protein MJ252_17225 [archaeon]|nr:hypothetical protein [archaeon]
MENTYLTDNILQSELKPNGQNPSVDLIVKQFNDKFKWAMNKLDQITKEDSEIKSIKSLVEGIKFEQIQETKDKKKKEEALKKEGSFIIRKEKVNWSEIRNHERQFDKHIMADRARNEVSNYLKAEKEKEYLVKMEKEINLNKERIKNILEKEKQIKNTQSQTFKNSTLNSKDKRKTKSPEVSNLTYKRKEFCNIVNKANKEKIQQNQNKKKLSPEEEVSLKRYYDKQNGIRQKIQNYSLSSVPIPEKGNPFIKRNNRYNIDRRIPLENKPNYLRGAFSSQSPMRNNISINLKKRNTNIKDFADTQQAETFDKINKLYYKAEKMENLANNEIELEKYKSNSLENIESKGKIADYLVEAIQAKLEILKHVGGNN